MKILELFGKYDLRKKCVERYGKKFGEMYDTVRSGGTIGDFAETVAFIAMVARVRKEAESKTMLSRLKRMVKKYED